MTLQDCQKSDLKHTKCDADAELGVSRNCADYRNFLPGLHLRVPFLWAGWHESGAYLLPAGPERRDPRWNVTD